MDAKKIGLLSCIGLLATGCSLGAPGQSVRISIPAEATAARANAARTFAELASATFGQNLPGPSSITGFDCFGVNVMGSDIPRDSRFGACADEATLGYYPGIVVGLVSAAGGYIDVTVPSGPARGIQLIGLETASGYACPQVVDFLDQTVDQSQVSAAYELASMTTDIFNDTSVNLMASYDPAHPVTLFCSASTGPQAQLAVAALNPAGTLVMGQGACTPLSVKLQTSAGPITAPSGGVPFTLATAATGTTLYPSLASCTAGTGPLTATDVLNIPSGAISAPFFAQTTFQAGASVSFAISTSESGLSTVASSATVTAYHVVVTGSLLYHGTCNPLTLSLLDATNTVVTAPAAMTANFLIQPYGSAPLFPPTASFYSDSGCTTLVGSGPSPVPFTMAVAPSGTAQMSIYVSDPAAGDALNLTVSDTDGTAGPGAFSTTFN